jgi:hypothetical protein
MSCVQTEREPSSAGDSVESGCFDSLALLLERSGIVVTLLARQLLARVTDNLSIGGRK